MWQLVKGIKTLCPKEFTVVTTLKGEKVKANVYDDHKAKVGKNKSLVKCWYGKSEL